MRKRSEKLIDKKKRSFLIVGILSFLCLLGAVLFIIFYDYYPEESRVDEITKEAKNDTDKYKTTGWIRVQGTNIDYPVIYAPGYDFSDLTNNFAWNEVDSDKLLNKVTISGHNIMNLSANPKIGDDKSQRFESLMGFVYLDFVKDNKYIQYTFDGEDYMYKIYAISFPEHGDTDLFIREDLSKSEMKKYIENSLKDSIFKFDIDVNENDKLISLITCTRLFGAHSTREIRIDARMVRKGEKKMNYGVEKTSNYDEIDKLMKGGENNEKA